MKGYFFSPQKKLQYYLCIGDFILILLAIVLSYALRVYINRGFDVSYFVSRMNPFLTLIALLHIFNFYLFDLYNLEGLFNPHKVMLRVGGSVLVSGLVLSGVLFFLTKYHFGRQVLLIHLVMVYVLIYNWRSLFVKRYLRSDQPLRLAVIGGDDLMPEFFQGMDASDFSGFKLVYHYPLEQARQVKSEPEFKTSFRRCLQKLAEESDIDVIVYDSSKNLLSPENMKRIFQMKFQGAAIYDLNAFYRNMTGKVALSSIDDRWLFNTRTFQGKENEFYRRVKRLMEIFFSLLFIILSIPICLLSALLIKLSSKGPVFYFQERLGINKKPFLCIKFRTMIKDAEKLTGPVWSYDNDPRITRFGRFLRKTRLDELPQLVNILKGELSFVGPRPIREHFASRLAEKIPFYDIRFSTKPGLTGWAQVNHDVLGTIEGQTEKFQYELFYIQHMSFFLDLLVLLKTVRTVFKRNGS
jgi:exopolysaccharide biosynthesis polyprenyl glycosylphosphotransferase